jgi:Tfp pilus assembly protein PilV
MKAPGKLSVRAPKFGVLQPVRRRLRAVFDERGLSLIEVVVGAVIVGIAAIGVALMFGAGQAYVEAEGDNRIALFLAQQRIEQIRAMGHSGIMAAWTPPQIIIESSIPNYPGYRRTTLLGCMNPDDFTQQLEECLATTSEPWLVPVVEIAVTVQTSPVNRKARPVTLRSAMAMR